MSHTSPDSRVPAPPPPSKLLDESCARAHAPVSKLRSAPATGHAAFGCELAPLLAFARDPLLGTGPNFVSLTASRGPPAPAAGSCAELGAHGPPWAAAAAGLPAGATAGASAPAPAPGGGAAAGAGLTRSSDGRPGGRQGSAGSANACVRSTQAGASGSSDSRTSAGVPSGSRRQRRPSATTCAACEARHGANSSRCSWQSPPPVACGCGDRQRCPPDRRSARAGKDEGRGCGPWSRAVPGTTSQHELRQPSLCWARCEPRRARARRDHSGRERAPMPGRAD